MFWTVIILLVVGTTAVCKGGESSWVDEGYVFESLN